MECMEALRHRAHADQKAANLMMQVHVTPMVIKGVVEEVWGSERVLHHTEEEADLTGEAMVLLLEKISLILMENMFTGMIQICRQEKVIGYARIQIVEISILLGALTVTTATSSAIQHVKHMNLGVALQGVTPALLPEGLQGWLVHLVIEPPQERWPGTDHHLMAGVQVNLGDMQLDPLQNDQYGLQMHHLRKEWASVASATWGTVQSLSGLPLMTMVGGSAHMMVILTGVGVAQGLLGLTGAMICVTEAALLHGTDWWRVPSPAGVDQTTMLLIHMQAEGDPTVWRLAMGAGMVIDQEVAHTPARVEVTDALLHVVGTKITTRSSFQSSWAIAFSFSWSRKET